MSATPSVSICIPVYCGGQFLGETIRSVLDQTFRDFELVVLDNASTDGTSRVVASFSDPRIRVVTNPSTISQPENWRHAVELCSAPLVKLLCADDLLHPHCLEYQVAAMDGDPGLTMVASRRHMIDECSQVLVPRRGLRGLIGIRSGPQVARKVVRSGSNPIGEPGGVLFRRADYFAVGGWHPEHRWAMDLDLWMRLLQCGDFLGLPESLAAFRISGGSLSADNGQRIVETQRAIMDRVAATTPFGVRRIDRLLGRLRAPVGHCRRSLLFWLARLAHRRSAIACDALMSGRARGAPTGRHVPISSILGGER